MDARGMGRFIPAMRGELSMSAFLCRQFHAMRQRTIRRHGSKLKLRRWLRDMKQGTSPTSQDSMPKEARRAFRGMRGGMMI